MRITAKSFISYSSDSCRTGNNVKHGLKRSSFSCGDVTTDPDSLNTMKAIRQIYDRMLATIDVPPELQGKQVEIIMLLLDAENPTIESEGWPADYFEEAFGSLPGFPEREPHSS